MIYRVIGIMSGSSLDGLDIAFAELDESGGKWSYELKASKCIPYSTDLQKKLENASRASAYNYLLLHTSFGKYIGEQVNHFIEKYDLHHQVQLIASHGHTVFHAPQMNMTAQLGDGAAIAAVTEINVVSDLRSMDVAFGGQGAPIVPVGEKLLFPDFDFFLNIGGIANVSWKAAEGYTAFDVCAANRVLNMLAQMIGQPFDDDGKMAASGKINTPLLNRLNSISYYTQPFPKSLANTFGTDEIFPLVQSSGVSLKDQLRTYIEHIAMQVGYALQTMISNETRQNAQLMVTGGGAFNKFLMERLQHVLQPLSIIATVPDAMIVNYKEALIMALIGTLRWREEYNVLHSVTGATRSSIGGAVWIGQEA